MDWRPLVVATSVTALGWALTAIPVMAVLLLIIFMLPLALLDMVGVPGLGRHLNGFFVPSTTGLAVITAGIWIFTFLATRWILPRRHS